jgi:hypothetical protein
LQRLPYRAAMPSRRALCACRVYARVRIKLSICNRLRQMRIGQRVSHVQWHKAMFSGDICAPSIRFLHPMPARLFLYQRCLSALTLPHGDYLFTRGCSLRHFECLHCSRRIAQHIFSRLPSGRLLRSLRAHVIPMSSWHFSAHAPAAHRGELCSVVHPRMAWLLCTSRRKLVADAVPGRLHMPHRQAVRAHSMPTMVNQQRYRMPPMPCRLLLRRQHCHCVWPRSHHNRWRPIMSALRQGQFLHWRCIAAVSRGNIRRSGSRRVHPVSYRVRVSQRN